MRILVTGARGKVGAATVSALTDAGHAVTATDLFPPRFEAERDAIPYTQADLTDAGDAYAVVPGHDAVVHTAALPAPVANPPHPGPAPPRREAGRRAGRGSLALGALIAPRQRGVAAYTRASTGTAGLGKG